VLSVRSFVLAAVLATAAVAQAGELTVPPATQVSMLAKLLQFDRDFRSHAGDAAHILVVEAPGHAESHRVAQQLKGGLESIGTIGGLGVVVDLVPYAGGAELTRTCSKGGIAAVYLAPDFSEAQVREIARYLGGISVLTASSAPSDVPSGAVVGFDLVDGKPKILVNLLQAEKQGVSFSSSFLSVAKVFR
jgi:hypothetical protein